MAPYELGLSDASAAIERRDLSPVELVDSVLARIADVDAAVGAFATLDGEGARRQAREAERALAEGNWRGPLHGIPIGYKDLIDVAGLPTTASSRVPVASVARRDATVVDRLRAAGTITIGKTHTHEYAAGVITPTTRNPWDLARVPGGSSGGSAAAVAARECLVAVGTDTGGSIRIPASFCGVVGLKPTYGLVPCDGIEPLAWSLDHVGPITRRVADAGLVLSAMSGRTFGPPSATVNGLRIGMMECGVVDPQIDEAVSRVVAEMAAAGAVVRPFEPPAPQVAAATSWTFTFVEAATGHRERLGSYADRYGTDVRLLLEVGSRLSGRRYVSAAQARGRLRELWRHAFEGFDVVVGPTVPCEPLPRGEHEVVWPDGTAEAAPDAFSRLTLAANVIGLPAITLPCGLTGNGLPIGLQILARPYAEATLLSVAAVCEELVGFGGLAPLVGI